LIFCFILNFVSYFFSICSELLLFIDVFLAFALPDRTKTNCFYV